MTRKNHSQKGPPATAGGASGKAAATSVADSIADISTYETLFDSELYQAGALIVDLATSYVTAHEVPIPLSNREFAFLAILAQHKGLAFTADQMMAEMYEEPVLVRSAEGHCDLICFRILRKIRSALIAHNQEGLRSNCIELVKRQAGVKTYRLKDL